MKIKLTFLAATLCCSLAAAPGALAQTTQSILASGETQEFSDQGGSLRSISLDYKMDFDDTTIILSPTVGRREINGTRQTAKGIGAAVYHDWSDSISTRTQAFIAEDEPVFARYEFAQDLTVKVATATTMTGGFRWAKYFAGRDVVFVSLGVRRYFKGGSIAYRLTRVDPDNRTAFLGHLVNLTLNDGQGKGKTQFWLSAGDSSLVRSQFDPDVSGKDWGAMGQRTQPLTDKFALVVSAGISSYARPAGRIQATTLGLGFLITLE